MSILQATNDDFQGIGKPLPNGTYRVTVLEAKLETLDNGVRLTRMYGNIRTPAGEVEIPTENGNAPYRIGNRKLFARSWDTHTNPQAQGIGQREIKREAVAAGLMRKPKKGESIELNVNDEYAASLLGRELLVRTQVRTPYKHAQTGLYVRKPTPEQITGGEVVAGQPQADVVAWVESV